MLRLTKSGVLMIALAAVLFSEATVALLTSPVILLGAVLYVLVKIIEEIDLVRLDLLDRLEEEWTV